MALGCISNSTNLCIAILLHTSVLSGSSAISKYIYYSTNNYMLTWGGGGRGGLLLLDGTVCSANSLSPFLCGLDLGPLLTPKSIFMTQLLSNDYYQKIFVVLKHNFHTTLIILTSLSSFFKSFCDLFLPWSQDYPGTISFMIYTWCYQ